MIMPCLYIIIIKLIALSLISLYPSPASMSVVCHIQFNDYDSSYNLAILTPKHVAIHTHIHDMHSTAQMIMQPPVSTTAAQSGYKCNFLLSWNWKSIYIMAGKWNTSPRRYSGVSICKQTFPYQETISQS